MSRSTITFSALLNFPLSSPDFTGAFTLADANGTNYAGDRNTLFFVINIFNISFDGK